MRTQVQRWGNSLAVRIPKAFAVDLGLERDVAVELKVQDGALVIRRSKTAHYDLQDLLSQVTDSNLHSEMDWHGSAGIEEW